MIKKILFVLIAFVIASTFACSQGLPRFDVSAGYSYVYAPTTCYCDVNGWNASVAFNLNKWVGVVGETNFLYQSAQNILGDSQPSENGQTFLIGPRFSYRKIARLQPFVQVLAGRLRVSEVGISNSWWADELGGGLDIGLNKSGRIAIRPQVMYLDSSSTLLGYGGPVYSIDLVYRFGGKSIKK